MRSLSHCRRHRGRIGSLPEHSPYGHREGYHLAGAISARALIIVEKLARLLRGHLEREGFEVGDFRKTSRTARFMSPPAGPFPSPTRRRSGRGSARLTPPWGYPRSVEQITRTTPLGTTSS